MKVTIYARYSSDKQRDASIADQMRVCRAFAERQGWTIAQEYSDRAVSGATLLRAGHHAPAHRIQGHDERPVPQGSRREDPPRPAWRNRRRQVGRRTLLRLSRRQDAEAIVLTPSDGELRIELNGNLAAMLGAANAKRSPETGDLSLQVSMIAGTRNPLNVEFSWTAA
jgi:hypothetical protein